MEVSAINQAYSFLIFMINGIGIGVLFDIFRILRKSFKTSDLITYIEDILFWILSGILTLYTIIMFNYGEIRLYIFVAIIIGVIIYMLTISKILIKFSVVIISFIKKIVLKLFSIVIYPIKLILRFIEKFFLKPVRVIFINLKGVLPKPVEKLKKAKKNIKKYKKTAKNAVQKKDFTI